jgi:signal recognition particle subunit SRP72
LYDQDNEDRAAVAGLVAAWSISSPQDIPADLLAYLPEASRLIADMDAAALESAGVPQSTQTNDVARKRSLAPTKPVHARAKRLRKARVPKEYVEGKKMDEERWLPMRDRSYYRPKGRKGKKRAEGLTQGGVVSEEKGSAPTQVKKEVKGKKKKGGKW